eukprot:TRINITY_DN2794_c0_g1_i1.p1 TRINITY_DN2794_c0_g1~~TRINITY_DN2794_c0_g1_i1.p1  ORF type:complete len:1005 (+),score=116.11 TRINITY_DN2794_c0_g1_i1:97-3015(+)
MDDPKDKEEQKSDAISEKVTATSTGPLYLESESIIDIPPISLSETLSTHDKKSSKEKGDKVQPKPYDKFTLELLNEYENLCQHMEPTKKLPSAQPQKCQEPSSNNISQTEIVDFYMGFSPTYELIEENEERTVQVYKMTLTDNESQIPVVLKIVEFDSKNLRKLHCLEREHFISSTFGRTCKYVAQVLWISKKSISPSKTRVELLLEYGGESLEKLKYRMAPGDSIKITYQLLDALEAMEKEGIAHLDLKPDNLVWDKEKQALKLIDFGVSISFFGAPETVRETIKQSLKEICGFTHFYAPPEILNIETDKGLEDIIRPQKIDAFCFGITLLRILLYERRKDIELVERKTFEQHKAYLEYVKEKLREYELTDWQEMILKCLEYDPNARPTFHELKKEFCKISSLKNCSVNNNATEPTPNYKILAKEHIMSHDYYTAAKYYKKALKEKAGGSEEMVGILNDCGFAFTLSLYPEKGVKYCKLAKLFCKKIYGNSLGKIYCCLGKGYETMTLYDKAIACYKKAEKSYKFEHQNEGFGIYKTFVKWYNNTEIRFDKVHELNNPSLATVYYCLCSAYLGLEDYETALNYLCNADLVLSYTYNVADPIESLLMDYSMDKAAQLRKRKQDIDTYSGIIDEIVSKKGESSIELIGPYRKMAETYVDLRLYKKAINQYYIKAIQICESAQYTEELVSLYTDLGLMYARLGQIEKAIDYFLNLIAKEKESKGELSPSLAKLYSSVGRWYARLNDLENAIKYYKELESLQVKTLGKNSSELIEVYNKLAETYKQYKSLSDSISYYQKLADLQKELSGESSNDVKFTYKVMSSLYESFGEYEAQIGLVYKALQLYKKDKNPDYEKCCDLYIELGNAYKHLGKYKDSASAYKNVETLCKKEGVPVSVRQKLAKSYISLAKLHEELKEYKEALECFEKSEEGYRNVEEGKDKKNMLAEIYKGVGSVYSQLGETKKADDYLAKANQL